MNSTELYAILKGSNEVLSYLHVKRDIRPQNWNQLLLIWKLSQQKSYYVSFRNNIVTFFKQIYVESEKKWTALLQRRQFINVFRKSVKARKINSYFNKNFLELRSQYLWMI